MRESRMGVPVARVLGVLLAVGVTVAVAAFGRFPTELNPDDDAVLRLSWRLRGSQVEQECRRPTPEELAELPAHMRNPDACVGRVEPYRLRVTVNGDTVADETMEGAGARHDRPIYVFRELSLEPGTYRVRVSFTRDEEEDRAEARPDDPEEEALSLELERTLELEAHQVALVTYDADRRTLVLRREMP